MATKRKTNSENAAIDPDDLAAIEQARADVDNGRTVSYERVRRWLLSWGTDKELPRPRWK